MTYEEPKVDVIVFEEGEITTLEGVSVDTGMTTNQADQVSGLWLE